MFHKMRDKMKVVVLILIIAMAGGGLWAALSYVFTGRNTTYSTEAAAVVATVNGQAIHLYDLNQVFINQLRQIESQQGTLSGRVYEAVRYQALDSLVGSLVLRQEIQERDVPATKAEIDSKLEEIITMFPSEEDYKNQLTYAGLTEDVLRSQLAEEIKFDKLTMEVIGDIPVAEEEIKEAFEKVRTSHILIRPDGDTDEAWAAAESQAWDIHGQVNTENFGEMAQAFSGDGSNTLGGDIGFVVRGQTVPEYEAAAFALEVGEISEPVRSTYGYHIITATEWKRAEGEEFEAARADLEDTIRREKGQGDLMAWYEQLREDADVVVLDYQMNAFKHMQEEQFEEAVHYYTLAIEQQPNDGYLYASLGDAYHELGNMDEAIAQYALATETYSDVSLFIGLGDLYKESGRVDEAVEVYLKASELAPNDIWTQLALYQYLTDMERSEEAMIVEERIAAFQEMQSELLKEQQEAMESEAEVIEETEAIEETEVEPADPED